MSADMLAKAGLQPEELAQPHLMLDDSRPGFWHDRHDVSLMRESLFYVVMLVVVVAYIACNYDGRGCHLCIHCLMTAGPASGTTRYSCVSCQIPCAKGSR
jgi:hypothetical protein